MENLHKNDKEIKFNTNNNSDSTKEINNKNIEDTQFYLITLEDNNGEHQQIRIFKNSDPAEIAFNFCKENNLDFKSMKYIKKNIQKIIEQFDEPNHKLFFLDNSYSSIQEVDEENLGSENTIKSKNSIINNENNKDKNKNNKEKNNINCVIIEDNINIKENEKEDEEENEENNKEEKNETIINETNSKTKKDLNENNNEKNNEKNKENNKENNKQNDNNPVILNKEEENNKDNNNIDNENQDIIMDNLDKIIIKNDEMSNDVKYNLKENPKINSEEYTKISDIKNTQENKNAKFNTHKQENKNITINNNINTNTNTNNLNNINTNNKISKETNISIEYHGKVSINSEKQKKEKNIEKNKDVQKIKKIINNHNINTKVKKNNLIQIKKDFISNIINKNILTEKSVSTNNNNNNNNNKKIKLQNIIPKLFKYINPKQHLINEEYKSLIKKDPSTTRENRDNIIDNYLKYLDKSQKSNSKKNFKIAEKNFQEKDKLKANKTYLTLYNTNLNLNNKHTKEKEKEKIKNTNIENNIENDDINLKSRNKKNKKKKINTSRNMTVESIKIAPKINKSLSNANNNNLLFQDIDIKKNKDKNKINKDKNNITNTNLYNLNNNIHTSSNLFLKIKKNSNSYMTYNNKKNINSKIRKMFRNKKDNFDNILSHTFIGNQSKKNKNQILINVGNQKKEKFLNQNKSNKNKVIIKRNKKNLYENKENKLSCDITKYSDINQNNFIEKAMKTFEGESGSKSKRISEMRNGLNKIFNNFLGQKNNILNTHYIINKRCRIINNKNKKNMSMNLSRYFLDYSQKKSKSPKYHLEINVSNNNIDNLNVRDNQTNANHKIVYNKNNNILGNNYENKTNKNNSNKKNYHILFNSQKQSILRKYNTNIKSFKNLNSKDSHLKTKKKIIVSKNPKNNNSSIKKHKSINSKYKDFNNINISNSLLINNDKTNLTNDYCLKILDQYYTINNTINITNNNSSLLSNFSNKSNKKASKIDFNDKSFTNNININNLLKNIFKCFDKDNNGFIILNYKFNIKDYLYKSYLGINIEFLKILEKMIKILYEMNKKYNSLDFDEDKVIMNENIFIKYMIYIYNKKLNLYERKIFSNSKNDIDKIINREFTSYNYKPKTSFSKFKDNKNILSTYSSSGKLYNRRENKSLSNDIHKYFFYQIKNNKSNSRNKNKQKFNSFYD